MLNLTYKDLTEAYELAEELFRLRDALDAFSGKPDAQRLKVGLGECFVPIPDAVVKAQIRDRIAECQKALNDKGIQLQAPAAVFNYDYLNMRAPSNEPAT